MKRILCLSTLILGTVMVGGCGRADAERALKEAERARAEAEKTAKMALLDQRKITARLLVAPVVLQQHWKWFEAQPEFVNLINDMATDLRPEDLGDYTYELLRADTTQIKPDHQPGEDADALKKLLNGETEVFHVQPDGGYRYYAAINASKSCLTCHYHSWRTGRKRVSEGDLIGIAKITIKSVDMQSSARTSSSNQPSQETAPTGQTIRALGGRAEFHGPFNTSSAADVP